MAKKALAIISPLLATALIITLGGCDYFSRLSTIEYNNQIVESLNSTSEIIESTITAYDESVPDIVTEESEIDTTTMTESLESALSALKDATRTAKIESKDQEQQTAVSTEFEIYLELAQTYLDAYGETLNYYKSETYIEDLTLVSDYDNQIYETYNDFIESNNELVDVLESYI